MTCIADGWGCMAAPVSSMLACSCQVTVSCVLEKWQLILHVAKGATQSASLGVQQTPPAAWLATLHAVQLCMVLCLLCRVLSSPQP